MKLQWLCGMCHSECVGTKMSDFQAAYTPAGSAPPSRPLPLGSSSRGLFSGHLSSDKPVVMPPPGHHQPQRPLTSVMSQIVSQQAAHDSSKGSARETTSHSALACTSCGCHSGADSTKLIDHCESLNAALQAANTTAKGTVAARPS